MELLFCFIHSSCFISRIKVIRVQHFFAPSAHSPLRFFAVKKNRIDLFFIFIEN